ncbi:MAG: gamma-glutamyl-gamma-aminobutyrate hydrolase family protein [Fidelibacterota bacterium]
MVHSSHSGPGGRRPVIGINPYYYSLEDVFWMATKEAYAHRIWEQGGIPFILTHPRSQGSVSDIARVIDGLTLIGGPDLPVNSYGGSRYDLKGEEPMHPDRVSFDRQIFECCRDQGKPILGICAGLQHINVIHGGDLYEDIASQLPGAIDHGDYKGPTVRHEVTVDNDSLLYRITGQRTLTVTSTHHQGIKRVGSRLKPTAWSGDGLVEAVESASDDGTFVAVQWHPEKMGDDPHQKTLFRWLVEESAAG